jgi:hypothetical protein
MLTAVPSTSGEGVNTCKYEAKFGSDLEALKTAVKKNYIRLAKKLHPDKKTLECDPYKFGIVTTAYQNLRSVLGVDGALSEEPNLNGHVAHKLGEDLKLLEIETNLGCCSSNCPYKAADESVPASSVGVRVKNPRCSFSTRYIFYDYECTQEAASNMIHVPILIVAIDFQGERYIFHSNNEFCKWAISKEHRGYTFIGHYARGYDANFVLKYCLENSVKPYIILQGLKLMMLSVKKLAIRFIDSHNFIPSPLASFPDTFGITELKKGYFPHLWNTKKNQSYVGSIPTVEYYSCEYMKPKVRDSFLKWHAERVAEEYIFDMKKEMLEYCTSDVALLREGCLMFRDQFLAAENIDPFCYLTLPSLCMNLYRSHYMIEDSIAVFNNSVYHGRQYSKESISWLESLPNADEIKHGANNPEGEIKICGVFVDGYLESTCTCYQFYGCYFHACPICYPDPLAFNQKLDAEMGELYQRTKDRADFLRSQGYNVVEQWECLWKASTYYKKKDLSGLGPLDPRDGYFGRYSI